MVCRGNQKRELTNHYACKGPADLPLESDTCLETGLIHAPNQCGQLSKFFPPEGVPRFAARSDLIIGNQTGHGCRSFGGCVSPVIKKFWRDSGWVSLSRRDRHRLRRPKRDVWCLTSIAHLCLGSVCFSFRFDPCHWG